MLSFPRLIVEVLDQIKLSTNYPLNSLLRVLLVAVSGMLALAGGCGSSSGGQLAFISETGNDRGIIAIDVDSGQSTRLAGSAASGAEPAWSPNRRQIAYVSAESGSQQINVFDREQGETVRLTNIGGNNYSPRWSPDGRRIAFISDQDGDAEVYLINSDGSAPTQVIFNETDEELGGWSPDGEWLVFYSVGVEERKGLWLRNPDGVNLVRLTHGNDRDPVWSPDGRFIAFVREDDDGNSDIRVIARPNDGIWKLDNGKALTQHEADDDSPAWSSNSQLIAYVSRRDGNAEIYVMAGSDGLEQKRLTNNMPDDLAPVWSPDGRQIAFVSELYGPGEILVMNADGSRQRRLTNNAADDRRIAW